MNLLENKEKYFSLLKATNRPGIDSLIDFLDASDFMTAPASTRFHLNVEGGLCQHSLNVYNNLKLLIEHYQLEIPEDSIILTALLHDLSKVNFYTYTFQNKKEYTPNGQQYDSNGRYNWISVGAYRVKDTTEKEFVFHSHEVNSYMVASRYIKLTEEEAVAIMNHHAVFDNGNARLDISEIYNRYPLAALLHIADTMATYIDENPYQINE